MIIRNVELPLMRVESNHELLSTNVQSLLVTCFQAGEHLVCSGGECPGKCVQGNVSWTLVDSNSSPLNLTISYDEAEYKLSLSTYVWPVVEWLGRWTRDQQVASSNPGLSAIECNHGQVVNTHVPLSPSSIIWYQPMGGDALRLGR